MATRVSLNAAPLHGAGWHTLATPVARRHLLCHRAVGRSLFLRCAVALSPLVAIAGIGDVIGASGGCHERKEPPGATSLDPGAGGDGAEMDAGTSRSPEPADAHDEVVAAARAALDAGTWEGGLIGAASMHTTVVDRMSWPDFTDGGAPINDGGATRLGYLRYGAKVAALPEPFANEDCREGWYELVEGGYVCGKYATFDLKDPRVRLAPGPPSLDAPMPYKYGYATGHGTPVYRRVLSLEDRKKYEPWLVPPTPAAEKSDDAPEGDTTAASDGQPSAPAAPTPSPSTAPTSGVDASVPWFMRDAGGQRPSVTLDDLHGRGVLVRRMMRGFYLALDRDFKAAHARWWRTTAGFAVPFERVGLQPPPSEFHGSWIRYDEAARDAEAGPPKDPNGTGVLLTSGYAARYVLDADRKKILSATPLPKNTAVALVGEAISVSGQTYHETTYGYFVRPSDGMIATAPSELPPDAGPPVGEYEKWVDVDTTRQLLVAYEGRRPVFMTLISSGKRNANDPEKDHPTPPGFYRIREKHITATMDGDVAADGPYSIEDVPWVMYFQGSYALHAAFWHSSFGHTRSHGCVNMAPLDARALFFWTEPRLPTGWHGVYATDANLGTRVVVHEDAPKKK